LSAKTELIVPMIFKEPLPHIWIIDLNLDDQTVGKYISLLSDDELDRASRFRFRKDYKVYVITRASLRTLLAKYLKIQPAEIQFAYSKYGKPSINEPGTNIEFNVSHAHQMALIGISSGVPIGVDIEWINFDKDLETVAKKFFSDNENMEFNQLSEWSKPLGFFNCWTRKESFIKAVGHGLSFPLKEFDVSLIPGEPAILKQTHFDRREKKKWSISDIHLPHGYVGAYAIRRQHGICQTSIFKHLYC